MSMLSRWTTVPGKVKRGIAKTTGVNFDKVFRLPEKVRKAKPLNSWNDLGTVVGYAAPAVLTAMSLGAFGSGPQAGLNRMFTLPRGVPASNLPALAGDSAAEGLLGTAAPGTVLSAGEGVVGAGIGQSATALSSGAPALGTAAGTGLTGLSSWPSAVGNAVGQAPGKVWNAVQDYGQYAMKNPLGALGDLQRASTAIPMVTNALNLTESPDDKADRLQEEYMKSQQAAGRTFMNRIAPTYGGQLYGQELAMDQADQIRRLEALRGYTPANGMMSSGIPNGGFGSDTAGRVAASNAARGMTMDAFQNYLAASAAGDPSAYIASLRARGQRNANIYQIPTSTGATSDEQAELNRLRYKRTG